MMPESYDVTVAGGGSAGLAAALAAARAGARTLLTERHRLLGGMGTNAMVHTVCGLFHPDISQGPRWLNPGIPVEVGQLLLDRTNQAHPDLMGRVYVLRHQPAMLGSLARELCAAEPNLTVLTGAELMAVEPGWKLVISHHPVQTRVLIDTTGDATIARLLTDTAQRDSLWQIAPVLYRPAYVFSFEGLSTPLDEMIRLQVIALIARAVKQCALPEAALGTGLRASPLAGEVFVTIDLEAGSATWNPLIPGQQETIEAEGRELAQILWRFLRGNHPAFAGIQPPVFPVQAGIRESARWRGDYTLTAEDLTSNRRFENEAALAGWPLEIRETARGPKFRYFDRDEPAGIPDTCLRHAALPDLYFAGRCLSCTHEALASVRVMGTCLATGQAAGRLAVV